MKKLVAVALTAIMTLSLAACGGGSNTSGSSTSTAAEGETLVVQIAYENNPGEPIDLGAQEWKRLVEERSEGTITVELFPSGQLGKKTDLIDQMLMGEGVIHIGDAAFWADYGAPEIGIASAPYIYDNWEQYHTLLTTDWWNEQVELLADNGLRLVSSNWEYGVRELMTTKPVRTLEDLNGLIIRTPNNVMQMKTWEGMGAAPTAMDLSDVYTATSQGTIDGMENPIATLYGNTYYEVAKYITMIDYIRMPIQWVTSEQWFQSLTEEQQTIIMECGDEAGIFHNNKQIELIDQYLTEMQDNGVEVIYPDETELARFKEAALKIYDNEEVTKDWSEGLYDKIRAEIAE